MPSGCATRCAPRSWAPDQNVVEVTRGQDVRDTFAEVDPDLVVLDMQIGNMGGVAVAIDLRLEESGGASTAPTSCCCSTARPTSSSPAAPTSTSCSSSRSTPASCARAAKQLLPAASERPRAGGRTPRGRARAELLLDLRARRREQGRRRPREQRADPRRCSRDARPDDAVLSEESKDDPVRLERERVWIVDPLDGTREFGEAGRSDWAVHVALVVNGTPHACAVALPAQDDVVLSTGAPPALAPRADGQAAAARVAHTPADARGVPRGGARRRARPARLGRRQDDGRRAGHRRRVRALRRPVRVGLGRARRRRGRRRAATARASTARRSSTTGPTRTCPTCSCAAPSWPTPVLAAIRDAPDD